MLTLSQTICFAIAFFLFRWGDSGSVSMSNLMLYIVLEKHCEILVHLNCDCCHIAILLQYLICMVRNKIKNG